MAEYDPPIYDVPVFNPAYFIDEDEITKGYLRANFLEFPIGQGLETLPDLRIENDKIHLGLLSISSTDSVAIGHSATATGTEAISIGHNATSNGNEAVVIGHNSSGGEDAVVIGHNNTGEQDSVVLGHNNTCAENSVVLGHSCIADGENSLALGHNATTSTFDNSVAIGNGASAVGFSTSLGQGANASGGGSLSCGVGSSASGLRATAIGRNTQAIGQSSVALGDGATASANYEISLGNNSNAFLRIGGVIQPKLIYSGSSSITWSSGVGGSQRQNLFTGVSLPSGYTSWNIVATNLWGNDVPSLNEGFLCLSGYTYIEGGGGSTFTLGVNTFDAGNTCVNGDPVRFTYLIYACVAVP